jgi:membrane fusion protein, macrolide-specific efflux system
MRKFWIAIIVVIIIVSGFFFIRKRHTTKSKQTQFSVTEVTRGNIEVKVLSTGTIEPYTRVEVNSPVNGRIERVDVDEGDVVKPGDILAWISSEDRIALLDAARSNLEDARRSGDSAAIKEALAAQQIANNAYLPVPLTNSIAGVVIARSCEPGQNISTATVLFVISDRLVANVPVDEADIGKITLGQNVTVTLDAFPDESVPAKVTKISHEGTLVSDVVEYNVMVEPTQVPAHWKSGMTADVEFVISAKDNVLVIPKNAVKEKQGNSFVTVLQDNKPTPQPISTGITDGKMVEVTEGLAEGDKIMTSSINGINGIQLNQNSRFRGNMMPPPGMMH